MLEIALVLNMIVFITVGFFYLTRSYSAFRNPLTLYLLFHFIVFVFRPTLDYYFKFELVWRYIGIIPTDEIRIKTICVESLSLIFICIGFHLVMVKNRRSLNIKRITFSLREKQMLILTWAILGPIAIYSAALSTAGVSFDESTAIQMERINGVAINVSHNGYLLDAQNMLVGLCITTIFIFNFRRWSFVPTLLFFGYKSYMGWGRWGIVLTVIMILGLYLHKIEARWVKKKFIIILVPFLVLFHQLGTNRDLIKEFFSERPKAELLVQGEQRINGIARPLDALDFANFEFLSFILEMVPNRTGTFTYGTQHLQLFTEPIPRKLWPGKPAGAPVQMIDLNKYGNFIGLTYSLPGDLWVSAGPLGITLGMFICGIFLAMLFRWHLKTSGDGYCVIVYYIVFAILIQFFRDGGLVSLVKFSLFTVAPVLAITFLNSLFPTRTSFSRA